MLKKLLGVSTFVVIGLYASTFMFEGTVKASGLDRDVMEQLEIMYGDNWEQLLVEEYGENWSQQLEARYRTSVNDCVMMEVGRLNENQDEFFEQCLEVMYGSNWESRLEEKYGVTYEDQIPSEVEAFLSLSADSSENEDEITDNPENEMPRYNQNRHCHE